MRSLFKTIVTVIGVAALAVVVVFEAHQVSASCILSTISVPPQPACTEVDPVTREIDETVEVFWAHSPSSLPSWEVLYAYTPANSVNIVNGDVFPESAEFNLSPTQWTSGGEPISLIGELAPGTTEGKFQLSFVDITMPIECSGTHDVRVVPSTTGC